LRETSLRTLRETPLRALRETPLRALREISLRALRETSLRLCVKLLCVKLRFFQAKGTTICPGAPSFCVSRLEGREAVAKP
jgi:hypothetical protein